DYYTKVYDDDSTVFVVWTKQTEAVEKTAANVITKIEISDADVTPYIGEKAGDWSDYTLPANCHYTAKREYWHREGTDGGEVLSDDVFEEGVRYDRYWYFKADEGYIFDENAVITINGSTALVDTFFSRYYENEFSVWTKQTEAVENTVINKIEITDVDLLPIIGEKTNDHIDYTFSENCHFTAAEHGWYDRTDRTWVESADDTFVAGHIYQVGWWLDADWGYTFAEDPTITINGEENINWEYTYIDEEDSMRFYVWSEPREAVELTVIDKIEINGFCDAVVGGKAGDFIRLTLPEDAPYHIKEDSEDSPCWENNNNGVFLEDDDVFEAGKSYALGCTLIADAGYIFAEDAGVFLNGGDVGVDEKFTEIDSEDEGIFYVWSEPREAVELTVIDKIEINGFCDAVVGGKAGDFIRFTLPEDAPYYFDYSFWYNDTDIYDLSSGDTFEAGKFYSLGGGLIADAGYIFAEDAEVLLNGGDVGVDESWTKRDDTDAGYFYVWSEPREAVEPIEKLLGDANDDGAVNMKDVLALRKQLAGMNPEINMTNADCNEDGDVNMKDVLLLRKFLAGLITELGA
ncbi:MAG: dockerin type I repeat-containing protein, partial [Clostridia bacterium]|nr:dockerin type I repeat-containing protein [Clostridia bacterium]